MIEQQPEHFGLELLPLDRRRGRDRDEVAPEIDPVDHLGGEQGAGERARLGGVGIGEVAPAGLHHGAAGEELAGRRVGRAFGFDQHEGHVAPGGEDINPTIRAPAQGGAVGDGQRPIHPTPPCAGARQC